MFTVKDRDILISLINPKTAGTIEEIVRKAMSSNSLRSAAAVADPFQAMDISEEAAVNKETELLDDVLGKARMAGQRRK